MATATILASGATLGTYRLEDRIAVGDVASVYRAQQILLGRMVALQVLNPEAMDDASCRERFRLEGRLIASLDHPNVLTIYDFGEADGLLYIAMRLAEGTTLAERLRGPGLSADETLSILGSAASALDAAHAIGLIHRSVQPDHILIDSRGHAHLAYFGLAAGNAPGAQLTPAQGVPGGAHYLAPEQIRGEEPGIASDVYSLTAVLYACLAGEVPYPRDSEHGVMSAHLYERPPRLLSPTSVAAELNYLIARGMAKRPRDRYLRAGELIGTAAAVIGRMSATRRWDRPAFPAYAGAALLAPPPQGVDAADELGSEDWLQGPAAGEDIAYGDAQYAGAAVGEHRGGTWKAVLRAGVAVVAAMAVAVAAAAGLLVAVTPAASRLESARSGPVTVAYRPPWRTSSGTDVAASALRAPIVLRSGDATLAAGSLVSSSRVPAGPPPRLERLFGAPSSQSAMRVAGRPGMRYGWKVAGHDRLVAQVLASAAADISIVCSAPAGATREMDSCLALAAQAKVARSARILPPETHAGVTAQLAAALRPTLSARLDTSGLSASALPRRGAVARALAAADRRSARMLEAAAIPSRDRPLTAAVADALRRESGAFSALAAASAADDRDSYTTSRSRVLTTSAALSASLASLGRAGFSIPAPGKLEIPAAPPVPKSPSHLRGQPRRRTRGARHHVLVVHSHAGSSAPRTGSHRTTRSVTAQTTTAPVDTAPTTTTPAQTAPTVSPAATTPAVTTTHQTTSSTSTSSTSTSSASTTTSTTPAVTTTPRTRHPGGGQTISGSGSV